MRAKFLMGAAMVLVLSAGCSTPNPRNVNYADINDDCPECGEQAAPGQPGRYASPAAAASTTAVQGLGYKGPMPLRSAAQILRIWTAPWESMDGALHLPTYLYAEVEERRWSIGEKRMEVAPQITPLEDRTMLESLSKAQKKPVAGRPSKSQAQQELGPPIENPNPAPQLDLQKLQKSKNDLRNSFFDRKTGQVKRDNFLNE